MQCDLFYIKAKGSNIGLASIFYIKAKGSNMGSNIDSNIGPAFFISRPRVPTWVPT